MKAALALLCVTKEAVALTMLGNQRVTTRVGGFMKKLWKT